MECTAKSKLRLVWVYFCVRHPCCCTYCPHFVSLLTCCGSGYPWCTGCCCTHHWNLPRVLIVWSCLMLWCCSRSSKTMNGGVHWLSPPHVHCYCCCLHRRLHVCLVITALNTSPSQSYSRLCRCLFTFSSNIHVGGHPHCCLSCPDDNLSLSSSGS